MRIASDLERKECLLLLGTIWLIYRSSILPDTLMLEPSVFPKVAIFGILHRFQAGREHPVFWQVLQDTEFFHFSEHIFPRTTDRHVEMVLTHPQDHFIQSECRSAIDKRYSRKIDDQMFFGF